MLKLSQKEQKKFLNSCIVKKDDPAVKIILEVGDNTYYIRRAIELLTQNANGLYSVNDIRKVIKLLTIIGVNSCQDELKKSTVQSTIYKKG